MPVRNILGRRCSWRSQPKLTNIQELQTGGTENEALEREGRLIPPEGLGYLVTPPQPRRGREDIPEGRLRRMSKGRQRQEGADRGTDLHYVATRATIRSLAQAPEWGDSQKNEDRGDRCMLLQEVGGTGKEYSVAREMGQAGRTALTHCPQDVAFGDGKRTGRWLPGVWLGNKGWGR